MHPGNLSPGLTAAARHSTNYALDYIPREMWIAYWEPCIKISVVPINNDALLQLTTSHSIQEHPGIPTTAENFLGNLTHQHLTPGPDPDHPGPKPVTNGFLHLEQIKLLSNLQVLHIYFNISRSINIYTCRSNFNFIEQ